MWNMSNKILALRQDQNQDLLNFEATLYSLSYSYCAVFFNKNLLVEL